MFSRILVWILTFPLSTRRRRHAPSWQQSSVKLAAGCISGCVRLTMNLDDTIVFDLIITPIKIIMSTGHGWCIITLCACARGKVIGFVCLLSKNCQIWRSRHQDGWYISDILCDLIGDCYWSHPAMPCVALAVMPRSRYLDTNKWQILPLAHAYSVTYCTYVKRVFCMFWMKTSLP